MATSTTTVSKPARTFKGGSSPLTQQVNAQPVRSPAPFSITTPLKFPSTVGETFKTTSDIADGIIDDFKNMLLTNYGERLAKPDFGANLSSLLSERLSSDDWNTRASSTIRNTTQKYMPYISISSVSSIELPPRNDGFSRVQVTIIFSIAKLGIQDKRLDLTLTNLS